MRKLQAGIWVKDGWREMPSPAPLRLPFPAQCAAWIVLIVALLAVGWWVGRAVVEAVVL